MLRMEPSADSRLSPLASGPDLGVLRTPERASWPSRAISIGIVEPPFSAKIEAEVERLTRQWRDEHGLPIEQHDLDLFADFTGFVERKSGVLLLVERGDRTIGTALLSKRREDEFELSKFCIEASERGCGIGRRLLYMCELEARLRGARTIYLETSTRLSAAVELYRTNGYECVGGHSSPYIMCDLIMTKRLNP